MMIEITYTGLGDWKDLAFAAVLEESISYESVNQIEEIIKEWYLDTLYWEETGDEYLCLSDIEYDKYDNMVSWVVRMPTSRYKHLNKLLLERLENLCANHKNIQIKKLIIGYIIEEQQ